jgi:hypothetical protein
MSRVWHVGSLSDGYTSPEIDDFPTPDTSSWLTAAGLDWKGLGSSFAIAVSLITIEQVFPSHWSLHTLERFYIKY